MNDFSADYSIYYLCFLSTYVYYIIHASMYAHTCTNASTQMHTHMHIHTLTLTHMHTHAQTHSHTHSHTHTHTHTCTEHKVGLSIPLPLSPFLHVILSILGVYFVRTGTLCISGVQFLLFTTVHVDGAPHDMWKRQQPDEINTSE